MAIVTNRKTVDCWLSIEENQFLSNTAWYYGSSKATLLNRLIWRVVIGDMLLGFKELNGHNREYHYCLTIPPNIYRQWIDKSNAYRALTCEDKKGNSQHDCNYLLRQALYSAPKIKVERGGGVVVKVMEFLPPVADKWHLYTGNQNYADYN